MASYYYAGGKRHLGTNLPANVMGDCPHKHRTPAAARACIERFTRQIQSQEWSRSGYCDRIVMVCTDNPDEFHPTYGAHFPYEGDE